MSAHSRLDFSEPVTRTIVISTCSLQQCSDYILCNCTENISPFGHLSTNLGFEMDVCSQEIRRVLVRISARVFLHFLSRYIGFLPQSKNIHVTVNW